MIADLRLITQLREELFKERRYSSRVTRVVAASVLLNIILVAALLWPS